MVSEKFRGWPFVSLMLIVALLLGACGKADSSRRLVLSAAVDPEVNETLSAGEAHWVNDIYISQLTDLTVGVDGKSIDLKTALREGRVTPEEMLAWARLDARQEICTERFHSENGLACFVYEYPECDLLFSYDIYETPDGGQHLIASMHLYAPGTAGDGSNFTYLPEGGGVVDAIDREDWGLNLEVTDASATGVILRCAQAGGQQLGQLQTLGYLIFDGEQNLVLTERDQGQKLTIGGETEITLTWKGAGTSLAPGEYTLRLYFEDCYDPALITPMIRKFHDRQSYEVGFTVS